MTGAYPDAAAALLQPSVITADPAATRDHRWHTFWVHRLLRFQETRATEVNTALPGLPNWILYAHRAGNSAPTILLGKAAKAQLWNGRIARTRHRLAVVASAHRVHRPRSIRSARWRRIGCVRPGRSHRAATQANVAGDAAPATCDLAYCPKNVEIDEYTSEKRE
ncbi:hypothetical protein [Xanthomonas cassavae]|uniref:hypothetical protein n=1 Tax=Xanthomonas cassavae TaxID=56450 RepID=UPI0013627C3A